MTAESTPREHGHRGAHEARRINPTRAIWFAVVGGSGVLVDLSAFSVLLVVAPLPLARAVAIWVAMTWNFVLNRRITFAESRDAPILPQYVMFCAACMFGAVVSWTTSVLAHPLVDAMAYGHVLAALAGIVAGTGFNYVLCCAVVFRRRREVRASVDSVDSGSDSDGARVN